MLGLAVGSLLLALAGWRLAGALVRRGHARLLLTLLAVPSLLLPLLLALGLAGRLRPGWALPAVAGLAAVALPARGRGRGRGLRLRLRLPAGAAGWLLLGAGGGALALALHAALLLPPGGWDEWWYHLPPLAAAVQKGRLLPAPLPLEWQDAAVAAALYPHRLDLRLSQTGFWAAVYPQGAELWALWPALFLHNDWLVDASQAYFALLGAAAVYALGRALGARRPLALTAAGLWLCTPVVLGQSVVVASDLALAAGTLAALAGCVAYRRRAEGWALAAWALGAGLAVAAKATGLALAAVWLVLAVALAPDRRRRAAGVTAPLGPAAGLVAALGPAAAVLAGCLALGGYWYWRNWRLWGNPVYPVAAGLGPLRLPGLGSVEQLFLAANTPPVYRPLPAAARLAASWWETWPEPISYFSRTGGLGPAWTLTVVALGAAALAWGLGRTRVWAGRRPAGAGTQGTGRRPGAGLRGLAAAVAALLLAVQPGAWWPRYTLAVAGIGFALLPVLLQRLAPAPRRAALAALVGAALLGLLPAVGDVTGYAPAALALPPQQRTIGRLRHGGFGWVDAVPAGETIAHAPMALIYPLYGRRFEHPVVQVDGRSAAEWLAAIRASGATWVCAVSEYGPHAAWARSLGHALRPAGVNGGVAVWQVLP